MADVNEMIWEKETALKGAARPSSEPNRWHEEIARVTLLSSREFQVLCLLGNGSSNRGIARHLRITERTAKAHVARIMAKLGVESRLQAGLVSYAYQLTVLGDIPPWESWRLEATGISALEVM